MCRFEHLWILLCTLITTIETPAQSLPGFSTAMGAVCRSSHRDKWLDSPSWRCKKSKGGSQPLSGSTVGIWGYSELCQTSEMHSFVMQSHCVLAVPRSAVTQWFPQRVLTDNPEGRDARTAILEKTGMLLQFAIFRFALRRIKQIYQYSSRFLILDL